jgi:hypothetical protein
MTLKNSTPAALAMEQAERCVAKLGQLAAPSHGLRAIGADLATTQGVAPSAVSHSELKEVCCAVRPARACAGVRRGPGRDCVPIGHQERDFLPVARDRDLFALLDSASQLKVA